MSYALITESGIQHPINLKRDYSNVSFPDVITDDCLPEGIVSVVDTPNMADTGTQDGTYTVELVDGVYTMVWTYKDRE